MHQDVQNDAAIAPTMPSPTAPMPEYGSSFSGQIPGIGQATSVNGFIPGIGMAAALQPSSSSSSQAPLSKDSGEGASNKGQSMGVNDVQPALHMAKHEDWPGTEHPNEAKPQEAGLKNQVMATTEDAKADASAASLGADEALDGGNSKTRSPVIEIQVCECGGGEAVSV